MSLFREPTVFFRFDISCVFAASPRYRLLGPKPTRDLQQNSQISSTADGENYTHGVWRLETSFVI